MKSAVAMAAISAVSAIESTHQNNFNFMQFVAAHGKSYKTVEEYAIRFERYLLTDAYILKNNADPESTHVAGHNHLSDYTEAEYEKMLGARQAEPDLNAE